MSDEPISSQVPPAKIEVDAAEFLALKVAVSILLRELGTLANADDPKTYTNSLFAECDEALSEASITGLNEAVAEAYKVKARYSLRQIFDVDTTTSN